MAESVDAGDSKSPGLWPYEFESRPGYYLQLENADFQQLTFFAEWKYEATASRGFDTCCPRAIGSHVVP